MLIWKKDCNSIYTYVNEAGAFNFGFKDTHSIINLDDYQVPSKCSKLAETFRSHDREVVQTGKKLKLLEVLLCANDDLKIFITEKSPLYDGNNITGIVAHAIDVTKTFSQMSKLLSLIKGNDDKIKKDTFRIDDYKPQYGLTPRQKQCVHYLARGKSSKEIASLIHLAPKTVEHYIEAIKHKFSCRNKSELVGRLVYEGYANIICETLVNKQLSIVLED